MIRLKQYPLNILFTLGALTLLGSALARYAVVNGFITSPAVANEATGQTIPYEIKGKIVFITPDERRSVKLVGIGEYVGLS